MTEESSRAERWRIELGRLILYSLHAPPLSWLLLPVVPLGVRVVERLRTSALWLALALRALYWASVVAVFVVLHQELPFLLREDLWFVGIGLGAVAALGRWRGEWRGLAWLAVGFGALELALPPVHHAWPMRLLFGALAAAGVAGLGFVVGRATLRAVPSLVWGVAIVNAAIWGRQFVFYGLPGEGARASVAAAPGVRLVEYPSLPWKPVPAGFVFTTDPPRFLLEDCEGAHFVLGRLSGLTRFAVRNPDRGEVLDVWANNDVGLDCDAQRLYVGHVDTQKGTDDEVVEVDLAKYQVLRRMRYCGTRTPDTLRLDRARGRLYAFDDSGGIEPIELASLTCIGRIPGSFVRDFAVEPRSGDLVVWDEGHVKRWDVIARAYVRDLPLPSPRMSRHPIGLHYGQLAIESSGRAAWIADLGNGLLHRLDVDGWRVTDTVDLGRGIRYLAIDEKRGRVYVGNYLTGDLEVVSTSPPRRSGSAFVGRRMRAMWLSHDGQRLSFSSEVGGVSVELEPFLSAAERAPR